MFSCDCVPRNWHDCHKGFFAHDDCPHISSIIQRGVPSLARNVTTSVMSTTLMSKELKACSESVMARFSIEETVERTAPVPRRLAIQRSVRMRQFDA